MKKHCMSLCLFWVSNAISQDLVEFRDLADEDVAYMQESFKKTENLRAALAGWFSQEHFLWPERIPALQQKFHITDDILRIALTGICQESAENVRWEPFQPDDPEELIGEKRRLMWSITWLGFCADEAAKELLMAIAVDDTKGEVYRNMAVGAYIRSADARQVGEALARFLVGTRVVAHSTYLYAMEAYDAAEDDPQKRAAIVSALTAAALEKEEDRGYFAKADEHFAGQDKGYAQSPQRKKALERMNMSSGKQGAGSRLWLYAGVFLCALCTALCLVAKKRGTRQ